MKNQTKRVDDALASSKKRRPRIADRRKEDQKKARSKTAWDMVDGSVWDLINADRVARAKREAELMGDPLASPFKNDRERMLYNAQRYAKLTIAEAFAKAGSFKLKRSQKDLGNELPSELFPGQIINVRISSISKDGTVLDGGVNKASFATRLNLNRYAKFKTVVPGEPVKAKVLEVGPKETFVDLISPMLEDFILPRTAEPWIQNQLSNPQPIIVTDLHLVQGRQGGGGFTGKAIIPNVSEWVGEPFMVDAFIPGSQIVLNTTQNFEQFEGATVKAFIMSYAPKPNGKGMSLVCSVKNVLKYMGSMNMMELHKMWCDNGQDWEDFSHTPLSGVVTGVINTAKKCGVFVEIPNMFITGMINMKPERLVDFKPGQIVDVNFTDFDEDTFFNDMAGQYQHLPPYEIERGALKKLNIKPIFKLAE